MATLLQETEPAGMPSCLAVDILRDNAKASKSKKMCEYEPDEECICAEGEDCWLV
jgi:hypothetical protein